MRGRWIGWAIVVFWLVMTGLLIRRELPRTPIVDDASRATASLQAVDQWLGIFLDQARVGTIHWVMAPETRGDAQGARLALRSSLVLDLFGTTTDLAIEGDAWTAPANAFATFAFEIRSGDHRLAVDGQVAEGQLEVEIDSAGETIGWRKPVPGPWTAASGFGTPLQLPALAVGEEARITSFDPLTLRPQAATLRCIARERRTIQGRSYDTHVVVLRTGGLESRAWIDHEGHVLRAETPIGLALEVIEPDPAAWDRVAPAEAGADLLARTAVRPRGPRPFRGAQRMRLALRGVGERTLPDDAIQRHTADGHLTIRNGEPDLAETVGDTGGRRRDPYLAGDSLVQVDHPRIREHARRVIGDEATVWGRALRLHAWVFDSVTKEAALSVPSALEVLRTRRGDCNEHTVLFTALARSVGVPTRIAVGLVWSDELDGFYYHAWPEVRAGDWVAMDPTLGQIRADATHIKLLEGGLAEWSALVPLIGRLEIDIVEVE